MSVALCFAVMGVVILDSAYGEKVVFNTTEIVTSEVINQTVIINETIVINNTINNTVIENHTSSATGVPLYFNCGENGALGVNSQQWSCGGNGETGQEIILFDNATLTHMGLDCNTVTGSATINIRKNLALSSCEGTFVNRYDVVECDEDFNAGDSFQPFTVTDSGHSQCVITMRFVTR
jgi:hypothetical protein